MADFDRTERVIPTRGAGLDGAAPDPGGSRLGRYRLVEQIGEGGMGVVHLAVDPRGRAVAIKVLRPHVAHDDEARTRLGREVETLSRITDDRVASVIDADVMGPQPFIVTRYVPGLPLDELVEDQGSLAPDGLLRLARGLAEAIRSIHACGVVHRDIKPGNVLMEDGEPVIIDFGIAHLQDDVRHTVGGLVMGTPGYLSPELVEGAAITDATDWWGWAATITFAASGRPPFGRGRMDAVLSRVRAGEVDLEGVDPRLVPLLRASLSPDPGERPHADQVLGALERFAAGGAATVTEPSGRVWDDPSRAVPPGATHVIEARGTAVLPPVGEHPRQPSSRWAPPTQRPVAPSAGSAAYAIDPVEEGWDEPDVWAGGERHAASREGDPRIGLPRRSTVLLGLATLGLGLLAIRPGAALAAFVLWAWVARTVDRTMTGLVLRRYDRGRRRSDVPVAVALGPWHVVRAALAGVAALILPAVVALAGVFASALLLVSIGGGTVDPGHPLTLLCGGVLGVVMAWWGPGGASLRRGSRSVVRTVVPVGIVSTVVTGLLCVAGAVLAVLAVVGGVPIDWSPFSSPFIR